VKMYIVALTMFHELIPRALLKSYGELKVNVVSADLLYFGIVTYLGHSNHFFVTEIKSLLVVLE
jgi:hypothetical protein